MTLSASSVLHYWSSRFGPVPVVGGQPTHSRASGASWLDQQGVVHTAIVNTPREQWATVSGERRKVLNLEQARTNLWKDSENLSGSSWTNLGGTIITGVDDPAGGTAAPTVYGAGGLIFGAISGLADGTVAFSFFVRARTGAGPAYIGIYDTTDGWKCESAGTFTNGVVTAWSDAAGHATVTFQNLANGWARVLCVVPNIVAAHTTQIRIGTNNPDRTDVFGFQVEQAKSCSAYIKTAGATATRAADVLNWAFTPLPQAMMAYVRFVERGSAAMGDAGVFEITDNLSDAPVFLSRYNSGSLYVQHYNGVSVQGASLGSLPSIGDTVEIVATVNSSGAVRLLMSINGGAVADSGTSSNLSFASAWAGQFLWLNWDGSGGIGDGDFAEIKIVRYADVVASTASGIMAELQAFELGANGSQL